MGPMKLARLLICGTALTLLTGPAAYAEVQVTMHDGRVSVDEAELLRTICGVLHCPLPPMLEQS